MGTFDLFFHLILGLVGALWNNRESPSLPPFRSSSQVNVTYPCSKSL